MAVNKTKLAADLKDIIDAEVKKLEEKIDKHLNAHYEGLGTVASFNAPHNTRQISIDRIVAMYQNEGWRVEQREHNFLIFS